MSKTTERRTVLTVGEKITRVSIINGGNAVEIFSVSDCADHQKETNKEEIKGVNHQKETNKEEIKVKNGGDSK